jgi:predicted O-methyltransferase YrrM
MITPGLPDPVSRATRLALSLGFRNSCTDDVGRLLRVLVAGAGPGTIAEIGTGCGVGAAWMLDGMRRDQRFVSIERDARLHGEVLRLFGGREEADFLLGDWRGVLDRGPLALVFVDVTEAKDEGAEEVVDALAASGMAILDDFRPLERWLEERGVEPDERRERWLKNPRLAAVEILTTPDDVAIIAARL